MSARKTGSTPMSYRHNTVYTFSRICYESIEKARELGNPLVLTFGKVERQANIVKLAADMCRSCAEINIGIDIDL